MKPYCFKCNNCKFDDEPWYGLHKDCFLNWFGLDDLEQFQEVISRSSSSPVLFKSINNATLDDGTFYQGMFRKYSAKLKDKKYILKVEDISYPELPKIEFICNQIYKILKINVPQYFLIIFDEGLVCFVTENFMGKSNAANLVHIYHFIEKGDDYNCENIIKIIDEKVGRSTSQIDFVKLTLADSLIGNNDRHGRNLAFIQDSQKTILAPFYDNVSYLGIEIDALLGADHQPRGKVATKLTNDPSMVDYIIEWERLGFGHVVEQFRKTVSISIDLIMKALDEVELTQKRRDALKRLIKKRYTDLCQ